MMTFERPGFDMAGRHCLITGGFGFFGAHLARQLLSVGSEVTVLDIESLGPATTLSMLDVRGVNVLRGDAASAKFWSALDSLVPDYVFHLAAQPYAPQTSVDRSGAFRANVLSTIEAVKWSAGRGARFVLASSACVFGATHHSPLSLDSPMVRPQHYYSNTKRWAERAVVKEDERSGTTSTICRFGNIYGPGDRHVGRLIPRICMQLAYGQQVKLARSNGASVFEFLHVDDAVDAIIDAALAPPTDRPWHFSGGPESRYSVLDLASLLVTLTRGAAGTVEALSFGGEAEVRKFLDDTDSREKLGFANRRQFALGLKTTASWYQDNRHRIVPHVGQSIDLVPEPLSDLVS